MSSVHLMSDMQCAGVSAPQCWKQTQSKMSKQTCVAITGHYYFVHLICMLQFHDFKGYPASQGLALDSLALKCHGGMPAYLISVYLIDSYCIFVLFSFVFLNLSSFWRHCFCLATDSTTLGRSLVSRCGTQCVTELVSSNCRHHAFSHAFSHTMLLSTFFHCFLHVSSTGLFCLKLFADRQSHAAKSSRVYG